MRHPSHAGVQVRRKSPSVSSLSPMAGYVNVDPNRLFAEDALVDIHLVVLEWVALWVNDHKARGFLA